MIVLDTNVIVEIFGPSPELLAGVRRLPEGRWKDELTRRIDTALELYRGSRSVLPFDDLAADRYADVLTACETAGVPISTADAQIAATYLANNATCATRNAKDFAHTGVDLVDPWSAQS